MKQIQVSKELSLPPDIVTMATAALGIRGSGKTNTGVVVAEGLLAAGHQVIVIDPLDVWWGLKSSADGTMDGYPVTVLGGFHGDLPLAEGDGKVVADFLVENPVPAILSLRHLSKSAQRRLIADFAEHFYHRKGEENRSTPVLCIIDEASLFIPQFVKGESARMVGAIESWVRQGRVSGIGVMLIDQRAASVNKDVLSQVELMIAHRHTGPQDRKALQTWVQAHATADQEQTFMESLASLGKGEAWFWSPEWLKLFKRVQVRARQTFDSSATPGQGKSAPAPKRLAAVELEGLKKKLAATIEKARAEDPKELRRQLAELKRQLDAKPTETPKPVEKVKVKEVQILGDAHVKRLEKMAEQLSTQGVKYVETGEKMLAEAAAVRQTITSATARMAGQSTPARMITRPQTPTVKAPPMRVLKSPRPVSDDARLPEGERKILTVAAQYPNGVEKDQISVLTGYKRSSRDTYLQRLRGRGFVEDNGGQIVPTSEGVTALGDDFEPLPTGEALQAYWRNRLPEGERKILEVLVASYPNVVDRDDLDEPTGYKRSSRDTYLQRLSSRRLVKAAGRGGVVASGDLFD